MNSNYMNAIVMIITLKWSLVYGVIFVQTLNELIAAENNETLMSPMMTAAILLVLIRLRLPVFFLTSHYVFVSWCLSPVNR